MIVAPENKFLQGNALAVLKTLPADSLQVVVTSPPYWGLRTYGIEPQVWDGDPDCRHEWGDEHFAGGYKPHRGLAAFKENQDGRKRDYRNWANENGTLNQGRNYGAFCMHCGAWRGDLGLEPTVSMYLEHLLLIFAEIHRVLKPDGTLWLNMGDKYNTGTNGQPNGIGRKYGRSEEAPGHNRPCRSATALKRGVSDEFKRKDLIGLPWMLAFALRDAGWWLRRDIIWHKPNIMPESAHDRPHGAHEYIMLLTKSIKYYYNAKAIREPASRNTHARGNGVNPKAQTWPGPAGWDRSKGNGGHNKKIGNYPQPKQNESFSGSVRKPVEYRNKRSVWTIMNKPFNGPHHATFPPDVARPCILAGSRPGDLVLDPFMGVGTVALVAESLGRKWLGIELGAESVEIAEKRMALVKEQTVLAI